MIVLWGVPGDGPLDAVHACLTQVGADVVLVDQRQGASSSAKTCVAGERLLLEIEGPPNAPSTPSRHRIDFADVRAAYLRPVETRLALPAAIGSDSAPALRAESVDRAMITWADLATALVVNPPAAMSVNNSKPYQLRLIAEHGFAVPDTLVTTDATAVRSFAARHGQLIYKSVSGVRSIVSVLAGTGLERLEDVANSPTQFQEYIFGCDVRVHVVGDEVFATEVRSDAHDYRYASLSGHEVALAPMKIPDDVAGRCRAMASAMGLSVAGIDFRLTADGCWVCFEVNPSPAFVYYEQATGQPIAAAVARLLARADHLQPANQLQPNGKRRGRKSLRVAAASRLKTSTRNVSVT